jgi:hypothetical protein
MRAAGYEVGNPDAERERLYCVLSEAAHGRRGGIREGISPELRTFSYGPHPDYVVHAAVVHDGGVVVEGLIAKLGLMFVKLLHDIDSPMSTVSAALERLAVVRAAHPIDRESVERLRAKAMRDNTGTARPTETGRDAYPGDSAET